MATSETKLQIVVDAVNNAGSTFATLGSNLDAIRSKTENLRAGMVAVGAVGAVAFGGLALMTKGIVEASAAQEQTRIAFETMLGSAEAAQGKLKELAQFAANTPFELPQVEQAAKQLLAYGVTAKDLLPDLKTLGDIAAGVGTDKLPELVLAFGQVQAKGHLAGQELLQFTNAGVGLAQQLQKNMHVTRDEFDKLMASGQISSQQVAEALTAMTSSGGIFFDLMDKQSASLAGLWSNLQDQITLTARAIGQQLLPYLKPVVEQLIAMTQAFGQFVQDHPKLAAALLIGALAFTALLAVLLPLSIVLPGLVLIFTGLGAAFAFVTAMSLPVLVAVAAVVAILAVLVASGLTTKEAWQDLWLGIKVMVADVANSVIGTVQGMINFIIAGVNSAISALNKVISLAQSVPGIGKSISTISQISPVTLGTFNTDTIAANDLAGRSNPVATPNNTVNLFGNFLSENVAEQIGDLIMGKLKLSNQL